MRKIRIDPWRDLRAAVRRLERSKGKRIARRNARRAFLRAINAMKKTQLDLHPAVDESGNEIKPRRERGVVCPTCNVPMVSIKAFCKHWMMTHSNVRAGVREYRLACCCGKEFGLARGVDARQTLHRFCCHVRGLKDIQSHFVLGAIAALGGGKV